MAPRTTEAPAATDQKEAAKAQRVERRRRQILDAAAKLMSHNGFHATSMQSVADEASISVGLIYQYFGNKDDLLRAVIIDILEEFAREIPPAMERAGDAPEARLRAGFRRMVTTVDARRDAVLLSYRESQTLDPEGRAELKRLESETIEPLRAAVAAGVRVGEFRATSPELVAHNLKLIAHGWALKHWDIAHRMSLRSYIDRELEFVLAAIRA